MANKIYINQETAYVWTDSGGDKVMDLGGLTTLAVRVGAQGDLGSGARASQYGWQLVIDGFDADVVVGEEIHLYLAFSFDATNIDGDVGAADAAGDVNDLPNLLPLGTAVVASTAAADELIISGIVEIVSRYVSPVVYNETADTLLSTSDAHTFTLWPIPPEIQ